MSVRDKVSGVVKKHFFAKMPKKIQNLVSGAKTDLNYGPFSKADMRDQGIKAWPGYSRALDEIRDWASDKIPSEIWVDMDWEGVLYSEPEGEKDEETGEWREPFLENTYHLEHGDIYRAVFGSLYTDGGM